MSVPAHLETMRQIAGTLETPGSADNPVILAWRDEIAQRFPEMAAYCANYTHDSVPWCGLTVAYCMAHNGIRPVFGPADTDKFLWAQAWKQFGTEVAKGQEQLGDVLVLARHVTLFNGRMADGSYIGLGGNQSDRVRESFYAPGTIEAVRRPPPASITAGAVDAATRSGRGSWYSQYRGRYTWTDPGDAPGSAALGVPDDAQGIALYDRSTLGDWFAVTAPNGVTSIEQQTDIGPHPKTGRSIDISAAAAERFGYSPKTFPTDSIFRWHPIEPPAAVAGITPQQQAVAYRDLRDEETDMTDTNLPAAPLQPAPAQVPGINLEAIADLAHRVERAAGTVARAADAIAAARASSSSGVAPIIAPASPAVAAAPQKSTLGLGTGILGLLASIAGAKANLLGMPAGEGATMAGGLVPAVSLALSVLGAMGKVSPALSMVGALGKMILGLKPPAQ